MLTILKKLQRRIANYRGVAPETSLVSPTRTSIEDARLDTNRIEPVKSDKPDGSTVAKRKYRRHPKVRHSLAIEHCYLLLKLDGVSGLYNRYTTCH